MAWSTATSAKAAKSFADIVNEQTEEEENVRLVQQSIQAELQVLDEQDWTTTVGSNLSPTELAEIQRAIEEADQASNLEEEASLALARRLQIEEAQQHRSQRQQQQGNVRTVTHSELLLERLEGPRDDYFEDDDYIDASPGFRLNAAQAHEWTRRDHALVGNKDGLLRTKHDAELDGWANAHRLGLDQGKIHHKAYNSFQQSMQSKQKKGVAAHGTGRAGSDAEGTQGGAMDPAVRVQLSRAINNGIIERCNGVVKEGKEAIVYHADRGSESQGFDVAVKVFKRIVEFRSRGDYVDGDPRYARTPFGKASTREQLELWAEKEYRNLMRAMKAEVPVATPLHQKENILFMRFLGEDGWPSPQLRELELRKGSKKWTSLYDQVMDAVRRLFAKGRLVHGDLSEYNILVVPAFLVENKSPWIEDEKDELQAVLIDFGQAVDTRHPQATEFLERDLQQVNRFFKQQGVSVMDMKESIEFVTKETGLPASSVNCNDV